VKPAHATAIEQIARAMAELATFRFNGPSVPSDHEVHVAVELVGIHSGALISEMRLTYRDAYEARTRELLAEKRGGR
jgi:hypothetical protein